jgi:hypothetical protein
MPRASRLLGPSLGLVGVVESYTASEQAGAQVRQFVVATKEGRPVPVELRGQTISGVIAEGHRVALAAPPDLDEQDDRTQRPLRLKNLTTGGTVVVMRPGLLRRALGLGFFSAKEALSALIGALVAATLVVFGLDQGGSGDAGFDAPPPEPGVGTLVVLELIWLVIVAVLFYFASYRRWRWRGGRLGVWGYLGLALFGGLVIFGLWR